MAPCVLLLLLALVSCTFAQMDSEKTVTCGESSMTIEAALTFFPGFSDGTITLSSPSCTATVENEKATASTALSDCGTEVEEVGDNLVFKNKLQLLESGTTTRTDDNEITFSCSYPKMRILSPIFFDAIRASSVFEEDGFGQFSFTFEFFDSATFDTPVDTTQGPFQVSLRETFYIRITATAADTTELFVESCKATPSSDINNVIFHTIIEDGCDEDDFFTELDSGPLEFKAQYEGFKFIGDHEQVYLHCTVLLCIAAEDNTICKDGCQETRRKRSVAGESNRHNVVQGPLRLKRSSDEKGLTVSSTPSLAFTLNVIAETLLFAVAVVCAVVAYKMKKSKAGYEQFPPSEI